MNRIEAEQNVHVIVPVWSALCGTHQCRTCRRWIYLDRDTVWQHGGGND